MRIWSLHPKYLDAKGLVALWRETLLAKHVLEGMTKGYKNHPQLSRFKACASPMAAIHFYLKQVYLEAVDRGYNFDREKFSARSRPNKISVTKGQLQFEFDHLLHKLKRRDHKKYTEIKSETRIETHPLFKPKVGDIEFWEKIS